MTEYKAPQLSQAEIDEAFSDTYRALWNDDEQRRIDADIEKHRKADGLFQLPASAAGREVRVEQLSHDFVFGAHIFNFDQLGSDERNARYKELYGTLFNSATIAFYWKQLELEEGRPRFRAEYRDTAEFWNRCGDPQRPAALAPPPRSIRSWSSACRRESGCTGTRSCGATTAGRFRTGSSTKSRSIT